MPELSGATGTRRNPARRNPARRERNLILAGLVLVTGLAWALVLWQGAPGASEMGMAGMTGMAPAGMTMGLAAPVFLAAWVIMMAAMMFPPAAPMLLAFASIHAQRRARGQSVVPTAAFSAGYLLVWVAFGGAAFVAATWVDLLASQSAWLAANAERVVGVLLVLAGLYQLSPLKRACLRQCQSPLAFFATSWRDGYLGAVRMGLKHGVFCLGCCWLLFVLLFPLGVMNVPVMLALALLIAAEKLLPIGQRVAQASGWLLIGVGALFLIVSPHLLPVLL